MQDIWSGMRDAKPGGGGNYLPPGFKGQVKIKRCFFNEGFKQDPAFIAEFEVVSSNLPNVPEGLERSWYQGKLDDKQIRKTALGEICAFVGAALGLDANDEDVREQIQAQMTEITGKDNPLNGMVIECQTWNKKTKAGNDFTKHAFAPVQG